MAQETKPFRQLPPEPAPPNKISTWLLPAATMLAFLVLTIPTWRWLWAEWMANEYYSHGLLIPPVTAFLIWQRIRHDTEFRWQPNTGVSGGAILLLVAAGLYLFSLFNNAPTTWQPSP